MRWIYCIALSILLFRDIKLKTNTVLTVLTLSDGDVVDGRLRLIFVQVNREHLPLQSGWLPDKEHLLQDKKNKIKSHETNHPLVTVGYVWVQAPLPLEAVWAECDQPPLHWLTAAATPGESGSTCPARSSYAAGSHTQNPFHPPALHSVWPAGKRLYPAWKDGITRPLLVKLKISSSIWNETEVPNKP